MTDTPDATSRLDRERKGLRAQIRQRRRELDPNVNLMHELAIRQAVKSLGAYKKAQRVAMFFAFDGEPSLGELMVHAISRGKEVYVPVLAGNLMRFAELDASMQLVANDFGIFEPHGTRMIDARALDLVLTPLVAFDDRGTRIGVGRAYYDRSFAFLRNRSHWRRPRLLGVAHSLQQVGRLQRQPWDIPLWGIATEKGARVFGGD